MSPSVPDPDSPFASFAQPKKSAVEQYKERTATERQGSKTRWVFLCVVFAGTVLGAVAAVAIGVGIEHVPLALAYANGAALLGVLGGALLGVVSWVLMRFRGLGGLAGLASTYAQAELKTTHGNQWDKLKMWQTAWAALGIVCGSAYGAMFGTAPATNEAMEKALAWAMGGATLGFVNTVVAWFAIRRARRPSNPTPE